MLLLTPTVWTETENPCGVCRFGPVFALLVPYFCDIPRVTVTHILGVPITGKSFTYIIGLQVRGMDRTSSRK